MNESLASMAWHWARLRSVLRYSRGRPLPALPLAEWARGLSQGLRPRSAAPPPASRPPALVRDLIERSVGEHAGPTLIFDLDGIRHRMASLARLGEGFGCRFLMAAKSCIAPEVYALAVDEMAGFDVTNLREYERLPANLAGGDVHLVNPAFDADEIPLLTSRGNHLTVYVDSAAQFDRIEALAAPLRYGVRLCAPSLLGMWQRGRSGEFRGSRFGVACGDVETLRRVTSSRRHQFVGFHMHQGFSRNHGGTYVELADGAARLAAQLGVELLTLDLGGGFERLTIEALRDMLERVRRHIPSGTELRFEPGNHLFVGCGFAVGRITSIRRQGDTASCTLDLSPQCHLRWSSPTLMQGPGVHSRGAHATRVTFGGPTCNEWDVLPPQWVRHDAPALPWRLGDTLVFRDVMGYSACWNAEFNGVPPARVLTTRPAAP